MRLTLPITLLLPLLLPAMTAASAEQQFSISGWREAVVSVSDLRPHLEFFQRIAGWEVVSRSRLSRRQIAHWQLPDSVRGRQVLLRNPGTETGYVRLVRFDGIEQRQIRSNTQSWDTGALFDINVRVKDMARTFARMQKAGWQGVSDPVQFTFGPFVVKEWLARGPDGLVFALVERLKPPLKGWPHLKQISRSFNATQIVRDIEAARRFYRQVLGFKPYLEHRGASPAPGENVLGLPHNIAAQRERIVDILHPQGTNEGSVELIAFEGVEGRNLSELGAPPNLGLLMLRFPTRGLSALARHLEQQGITAENRLERFAIPPYGPVDIISVRSPEGAWLEFFQPR